MSACGGGNSDDIVSTADASAQASCSGDCANANSFLTTGAVQTIIAQAVAEAQARQVSATIAVVDRVGNVLAVFRMDNALRSVAIDSGRAVRTGLDGLAIIPDSLAAIAKAITGAYLSTEGNAFSTRTASQIVQQHFNPLELFQPAGPLFGVQFSSLPCSDFATRFSAGAAAGPHRSPLGLAADPGGLPLYLHGTPVGGVGVIADGVYGLDLDAADLDSNIDELIAVAAAYGYAAPIDRQASRITVEGKTLRYTDVDERDLRSDPATASSFSTLNGNTGALISVPGYTDGSILAGTAFAQAQSGIRADRLDYPGLDAFVVVDNNDVERFAPIAGTDGTHALSIHEVRTIMRNALGIANRARAQIRQPSGSPARVSIAISDTNGTILAIARSRDAPVFGIDVAVQKARTAAFFSNRNAASDLAAAPDAIYRNADGSASGITISMNDYVLAARDFLGAPDALANGAIAFADRSGGNLARPFYPDGIDGNQHGPFSKPFNDWSPFSTGLQLDLIMNRLVTHVLFTLGLGTDTPMNCTTLARLPNGIQIFPGSVPIYRGNNLVGSIGVSGDGVDQDDMIAFLGVHEAAATLGTIQNAPAEIRADTLTPQGVRLRYIQCPQAPFLNSNEQAACNGK